VDQLLWMANGEVGIIADVSCIGTGGSINLSEGPRPRGVWNRTRPAAVADGLKFSVPTCRTEPDFRFNFRITPGGERRSHSAECRQVCKRVCRSAAGRLNKTSRRHHLS